MDMGRNRRGNGGHCGGKFFVFWRRAAGMFGHRCFVSVAAWRRSGPVTVVRGSVSLSYGFS